ncbi:DUF2971 domain-containing protein [Allofournierella massiliensis]|uniref:DUF2971 family protein n=1 Tax=Allofournierella massiliensis TaxID=1650663 RepID=A0A4R1QMM3_9FIRM|nr:DUF2971 domain-containing protein [Fournierella massiliensis]TCL54926.1 DUF2971 family protein [Fournierella massiliensis]
MAEEARETLYHYCSLDTFYNIMENRSIWLSDISKSNDAEEIVFMTKKCREEIKKRFRPSADEDAEKIESIKKTDRLLSQFSENDYLKCWAMCFSEKADDLGQWRGYADDGRGVCIGFKGAMLERIAESGEPPADITDVFLRKVEYGERACNDSIKNTLSSIFEWSCDQKEMPQKVRDAVLSLVRMAPLYKKLAFKEEEEWRLGILTLTEKSLAPTFALRNIEHRKMAGGAVTMKNYGFTPKNNTLVSHIELVFSNLRDAIDTVIIGPKSGLSKLDVQLFLISLGLLDDLEDTSIAVIPSEASYR